MHSILNYSSVTEESVLEFVCFETQSFDVRTRYEKSNSLRKKGNLSYDNV